ncbi:MAG: amino acid permease [Saprospiraceae bacterium]
MALDLFRKKSVEKVLADVKSGYSDGELIDTLHRTLTVRDLTFFGIAAIVGAGIFSTIGKASFDGGPGIIFLFLFVAIACGFSALCYAQFASIIPVSGSAYTYSYVAFGELIAWIIGWDLLMEYAIGNIAVAISWSDYFTSLLHGLGLHLPDWISMDYWTAKDGGSESAIAAWTNAPSIGNFKFICDIPAFSIVVLITYITYLGIRETKRSANAMVMLKIAVIIFVIILGAFYINPANWNPFIPNGVGGILKGTAAVFFAYIGFDAISTTAEECKNPQRDLPRSMIYSLIICTVIYVLVALVLTGMVNYSKLDVGDPLSFVFQELGLHWIAGIVAVSAVIATASVLLVFQVGQPRIWMAMSRDGLLPKKFSKIHPKYKTPSFSTILTGIVVAVPSLFLNLQEVISLTSVGTLFAFVLVCGGILKLQVSKNPPKSSFKVPYINAKFILPLAVIIVCVYLYMFQYDTIAAYLRNDPNGIPLREKVPYYFFAVIVLVMAVLTYIYNLSLIPLLGFLSCSYLLCESGTSNWERFLIWLGIGLILYFIYGARHSKLNPSKA